VCALRRLPVAQTVLLYLNVGWDAAAHGGCLRVHPPDGVNEPPVDVSPVAGRLVLFHSRLTKHEVLPCTSGERVAVTLWVEYGED
jgi:SM-20-related protein